MPQVDIGNIFNLPSLADARGQGPQGGVAPRDAAAGAALPAAPRGAPLQPDGRHPQAQVPLGVLRHVHGIVHRQLHRQLRVR